MLTMDFDPFFIIYGKLSISKINENTKNGKKGPKNEL